MESELIELDTDVSLEIEQTVPTGLSASEATKLAICLHPWSWLGGRKEDPVLLCLEEVLREEKYYVIRYNSRGVGRSSGWASFTGYKEGLDLQSLAQWALKSMANVESLVLVGYSHGSLITSLHPVLPGIRTSHILISYPLGPRHWLTLFNSKYYASRLSDLTKEEGANILALYGDRDEFTNIGDYRTWKESLEGPGSHIEFVEVAGGSHFWRGHSGRRLQEEVIGPRTSLLDVRVITSVNHAGLRELNTSWNRPLPDERPRQSVANLIGRFETQAKKQPPSTSGSSRNSSVASNISSVSDAANEQAKERMEWPPRSVASNERPPPIVPSSSWTRQQSTDSVTKESSTQPTSGPPRPSSSTENKDDDVVATPRPSSAASVPEITNPATPKEKPLAVNVSAPKEPVGSAGTPTTAKPATKTPTVPKPAPAHVQKTATKVVPKSTPTKPAASATKPHQPTSSPASAPSISRKPATKTPITTARAQTPSRSVQATTSRPKTPSTARPKTPSSGLYAPTAASLARSRNAPPQPPPPVKKTTLSSSAAERLSKPTAASLSKMRQGPLPTSPPKPAVKAPARTTGPAKSVLKSSTGPKAKPPLVAAAKVEEPTTAVTEAISEPATSPEPAASAEETTPISPAESEQLPQVGESIQENVALVAEPDADSEDEGKVVEAMAPVGVPEAHAESPTDVVEDLVPNINGNGHKHEEPAKDIQLSTNGQGDDIEDMVNLLEAVNVKARRASITSIPDEVIEIPDENI